MIGDPPPVLDLHPDPPMEASEPKAKPNIPMKILRFLGGFHIACVLIFLLGVLTWLGTLEQVDSGLYEVKKKYFSAQSIFLFPKINGNTVWIPIPSAYWVGVLFFFNLLTGTIFRARWRWQTMGVLIDHLGMLFLLLGAFVTQHFSLRGNMAITEGQTSDVAEHYTDYVLEVTEMKDGKPFKVHVIGTEHLVDLDPSDQRLFRMANLPFDLRVDDYHVNARPADELRTPPRSNQVVVDGFFLEPVDKEKEAERNFAGCRVTAVAKDGEKHGEFLVSGASFHPATIMWGDEMFALNIRKALWKMPFKVKLDKFTHEFHPGTMRPKRFESEITRIEGERLDPVLIKMNEPMRRDGFTFFQASWGPQNAAPGTRLYSVFEVVKNPADKWPEYALYVTTIGLIFQFGLKLILFIISQIRKSVRNV